MECSGEKGLNKGRIHNNDTISLFSFTKDRLDMGKKKKIHYVCEATRTSSL